MIKVLKDASKETVLLAFSVSFFVLRMAIPKIIFVYLPLLLILSIYVIARINKIHVFAILRKYYLYFLICSIYIIAFVLSTNFNAVCITDLFHITSSLILVLFFEQNQNLISKKRLNQLILYIWVYFLIPIGILGILKYLNILSIDSPTYSTSLMTDFNFFSLAFLLGTYFTLSRSIVISKYRVINILIVFLFITVIIFSGSRRGVVLLLCLLSYFFMFKYFSKRVILFVSIFVALLCLFYSILKKEILRNSFNFEDTIENISQTSYRYLKVFSLSPTYENYSDKIKLNKQRYRYRNSSNLLTNGNFEFNSLYWTYNSKGLKHEYVDTPWGNGLKMIKDSTPPGLWSLLYTGRRVYFHEKMNYTIEFKFKPIVGDINSILVGFVLDSTPLRYNGVETFNLDKKINSTNHSNWFKVTCDYKFINDELNHNGFFNYQEPNTELIIADIRLTNNHKQANYVLDTINYINESKIIDFSSGRLDRFSLSIALFREYNWFNKILGKGFNYLYIFKDKFGRFDYPHNSVLSSLLYSGLLGAFIYLLYLSASIYYCIKIKSLRSLIIPFIMVLAFAMISGNSHFSMPVFIVSSLIPFIYNHKIA